MTFVEASAETVKIGELERKGQFAIYRNTIHCPISDVKSYVACPGWKFRSGFMPFI
jgi:hypothetical protein